MYQWFNTELTKDAWTTVTIDFTSTLADGDKDVTARDDMDMMFINWGGGGHEDGGEIFIRNLVMDNGM